MAGYTRQDTANNIANGNVIDADDFDAEYNQLESAFNASSGHSHDGTAGEGAPITKVGPSQDLVVSATQVLPKTTNTLDLGSASVQFKDAHFDGTVDADAFTGPLTGDVTGNVTGDVTGNVTGNVTGTVSDISNHDTGDLSEGTNKYYTDERVDDRVSSLLVAGTNISLTYNDASNQLTIDAASVGGYDLSNNDTDDVNEGTTNLYYTDARARSAVSVTDSGGDGSLAYNSGTGVITYTGPSATETRAHFSAGTGVTLSSGEIAIGQAVGTSSNVTFNDVVVSGDLTVSGTTTYVDTTHLNVSDNQVILNYDVTGTPTENAGIEVERGTSANKTLLWNEIDDKWTVGSETFVAGTFEGDLTGNADTATTLATARTIAGQSFDGSANISIAPTDLTGVTATATEINKLDGYTGTATDLNEAVAHYVPSGGIIMWSGAVSAIPTGWVLCDGTNSTPNLIDRFIVGSGTDSGGTHDVGDTGGANSLTLTEAQLPSHTHGAGTLATNTTGDHYHLDGTVMDSGAEDTYGSTTDASASRVDQSQSETKNEHAHTSTAGAHSHTISGSTGSTGSGSSIDNRPAYYALAFIMKT